jgi:hypothetical protein
MANKKISDFPLITAPIPTDIFLIDHLGGTSIMSMGTITNSISTTVINGLSGDTVIAKLSGSFIKKPTTASAQQVLTYSGTTNTWVASAAPQGGAGSSNNVQVWANFNGNAAAYGSGNLVTYAINTPVAGQTTVTVDRTTTWIPLPKIGDWITVSGVTGATSINGTYAITSVDNTNFNIKYVIPSIVTGAVAGTAIVYVVGKKADYNVQKVAKFGVGDYKIYFQNALIDANYATFCTIQPYTAAYGISTTAIIHPTYAPTNSEVRVINVFQDTINNSVHYLDVAIMNVAIYR